MAARKSGWMPIDLGRLKMSSLKDRQSKVSMADFARPVQVRRTFRQFMDILPSILAAEELRRQPAPYPKRSETKRPYMLGMGAHPIKVGSQSRYHQCNRTWHSFRDSNERCGNHS